MTWRDDLDRAENKITEIRRNWSGDPENEQATKEIRVVLEELWKDARNFDSSWDSD